MSTRRALALSFVDRYSGLVVHTAAAMVIARLLAPAEIGVYSVVMVLLGFVATFRDLGAGQYLVTRRTLTPEALRATFTVQLALGAALALVVLIAAVPIATFYREPRMQGICVVLSVNFLVTPWLAYPNAWLVRSMRFGTIGIVRFAGAVTHAVTAIGLVLQGYGPISLAWANLLTTVVGITAIHLVARPKLPLRPTRKGLREVLAFGSQLTAISLFDTLRNGAAELALGRLQGLAMAGYLSRAQGLVQMFEQLVMNAVNQVAFSMFSKHVREGRELAQPFLAAMALVTGLGWAFFFCLVLLAYPATRLLYGPQWDAAVEPVRWLALAAALALPGVVCQSPIIALGAVRDALRVNFLAAGLTVTAAVGGATIGLVATTQLMCLASAVTCVVWLHLARRRIGCRRRDLIKVMAISLIVALTTAAPAALVVLFMGWRPAAFVLALVWAVPGCVLCLLLAVRFTRHPLWDELERVASPLLRRLRRSR